MASELPPFKALRACPKCGYAGAELPVAPTDGSIHLQPNPPPRMLTFRMEHHDETKLRLCPFQLEAEHICKSCPRCRFQWPEACLDAEIDPDAPAVPIEGIGPPDSGFSSEVFIHYRLSRADGVALDPGLYFVLRLDAGDFRNAAQGSMIAFARSIAGRASLLASAILARIEALPGEGGSG